MVVWRVPLGQRKRFIRVGLAAHMALRRENWRDAPRIDYKQEPAGRDAGAS